MAIRVRSICSSGYAAGITEAACVWPGGRAGACRRRSGRTRLARRFARPMWSRMRARYDNPSCQSPTPRPTRRGPSWASLVRTRRAVLATGSAQAAKRPRRYPLRNLDDLPDRWPESSRHTPRSACRAPPPARARSRWPRPRPYSAYRIVSMQTVPTAPARAPATAATRGVIGNLRVDIPDPIG